MRICAPYRRTLLAALVAGHIALFGVCAAARARAQEPQPQQPAGQKIVENVDIQGNRRNRDEDLLYYVQTRAGDPYNQAQVERDFQALMALGFFSKTESRVLTQDGPRGGIEVIFEVKELPIIRDLQFEGLHSLTESEVLKAFRERRIGVQKENIRDPVKLNNAKRLIKELLAAKGHPNATVDTTIEPVSAGSDAITFQINEGKRVRVVEVEFEGNQVFKDKQLRGAMKYVKEAGLFSRFKGLDILDREKLDVDLRLIRNYMAGKGYLQGRPGEPRVESLGPRRTGFILPLPLLSSVDEGLRITIPIVEGKLYRLGELKIEGNSIFSEERIKAVLGLKQGDVASGERVYKAFYEELKKAYGNNGFIQYSAEPEPTFKDNPTNPKEGIVDYVVTIDEGKQFTLNRLEFTGNTFTRDYVLRREVVLNEGDIYNQSYLEFSILRLNQLGFFDPVDKDKDVDFRTDEERGEVAATIKVNERGRQQISFNGGISGVGGSFFGLEYSTNNLFGRGESLSLNLAAGNRQRSFVFSFTEPYFKNRQISAGFSLYSQSLKYFGEGTFLSQNLAAQQGLFGSQLDFFNTSEANLFTQTSTGGSIFASALLSEFRRKTPFNLASRVGLSYTISRTSVKDPAVNADPNSPNFIPVIYRQPNILTSRVTPSFVYDTRDIRGVDAVRGRQLAASLAFAGLGGDVRTYSPSISFEQFFPVRRKRELIPEVFGFRLIAGHVGSFATSSKVRAAQTSSLSFINGVPVYERFFLGDEYTIRGYNVRSIAPIVPLELFITSQNVVVTENLSGTPVPIEGLQDFAALGTFTGIEGANPRMLSRGFQSVGADTQLLGNFEYRVPIFGTTVSAAAFADIGSAFNLRSSRDQVFSTQFQSDPLFLNSLGSVSCANVANFGGATVLLPITLNSLAACREGSQLAITLGQGLVARDNRLVTLAEYTNAVRFGPTDPQTGLPFGFYQIFLRGDAQTNTAVRLSQSSFNKISDIRSSLGAELRVQLPILNVPFRLIYAFNPNARRGLSSQVPLIFREDRSVFRFSVGRTF